MILLDTKQPIKTLKVIKDSQQKSVPIVTAKFCDWSGPQGKLYNIVKEKLNNRASSQVKQDSQDESQEAWMIISIDAEGVVAVTTVTKIMFVYKVSRYVVVDPSTSYHHIFSVVSTRFRSPVHGPGIYDQMSFVALANRDTIMILETGHTQHRTLLSMDKPDKFYNTANQNFDPFKPLTVPALAWGYGMSPVLKERSHSMLAIGWGPIVQLVVLIDHEENDRPFILDGFYIVHTFDITKSRMTKQISEDPFMEVEEESKKNESKNSVKLQDDDEDQFLAFKQPEICYIEGLYFLSDSTILILLSGQEMRILDTQSFRPEGYDADYIVNNPRKSKSTRSSNAIDGKGLHVEELEIGIRCCPVIKSEHGIFSSAFPLYQQTMKFFNGKFVMMTTKGIQSCLHLTWQQSILDFQKSQNVRQSSAIIDDASLQYNEEEDMTQVFLRALELYKGRVKGYQGLIDNAYLRENFLRAELKLFVKEIIQQMVEDTSNQIQNQQAKPLIVSGLSQSEEKAARFYKFMKIVRIAIEFCVELKDCYFLFKDLCWLFQDHGGPETEKIFIKELENYIVAGKFTEWELQPEVIDSFVHRYYLHEEKPNQAQNLASPDPCTFEKIIVNLNLSQCPKDTILHFVKYCEQHFLTTGIIYLYTQLLERKDNASCVQVLFSLYDLYKRAPDQSMTKQQLIAMIDPDTSTTLHSSTTDTPTTHSLDRSHLYLGYKLFWLIRLYLNGRKFPHGHLKESKWRAYTHDIVQFLSNPEILGDLANLDAEILFQIISVLYLRTSKPFSLLLQGRDDFSSAGPSDYSARFIPHWDFLKDMDHCFLSAESKVPAQCRRHYLFFVANLVVRDRDLSALPAALFYRATRELLKHPKEFLEFNRDLQVIKRKMEGGDRDGEDGPSLTENNVEDLVRRVTMLNMQGGLTQQELKQESEEAVKMASEELRYIQKTENDYLTMMRKCEPLEPKQIDELLGLAEKTSFEQVQLYLLERKEEYVKCLLMLLREAEKKRYATTNQWQHAANMRQSRFIAETAKLPMATQLLILNEIGAQADKKGERTIKWLNEKIALLQSRVDSDPSDQHATKQLKQLKQETFVHIKKLLQLSRLETVRLIDQRFGGSQGHKQVMDLDPLRKDQLEQLFYLDTLLEEFDQEIQEVIRAHGMGDSSNLVASQAKLYIEYIKLRLRLCCQLQPERVFATVEGMVKSRKGTQHESYFFPVEECLQICNEYNQIEASFLLNKKLGKYYEAIILGLKIMTTKLSLQKLKIELYFAKKNQVNADYPVSSSQMPECYFFDAIFKRVLGILSKNSKDIDEDKEEKVWFMAIDTLLDIKQSPAVAFKGYCKRFFQERLNLLVEAMSRQIPFRRFLDHSLNRYQETQFKDFQEIILHVINNQTSEENVLINANSAIAKVNNVIFENFSLATRFGVAFRSKICQLCKKYLSLEDHDDQQMSVDDDLNDALLLDDEQDPMNDDFVKVFACQHTYHFPCLRRHLLKKQSEVNTLYLKAGVNNLRCPQCNIGTLDIDTQLAKRPLMPQPASSRQRGAIRFDEQIIVQQPGGVDEDLRRYRELEMRKAEMRMTKRENMAQNKQQQHLEKMKKRMEMFEQANAAQGLTLDDFMKVDQVKMAKKRKPESPPKKQEQPQRPNEQPITKDEPVIPSSSQTQALFAKKDNKSRFKALFKRE